LYRQWLKDVTKRAEKLGRYTGRLYVSEFQTEGELRLTLKAFPVNAISIHIRKATLATIRRNSRGLAKTGLAGSGREGGLETPNCKRR